MTSLTPTEWYEFSLIVAAVAAMIFGSLVVGARIERHKFRDDALSYGWHAGGDVPSIPGDLPFAIFRGGRPRICRDVYRRTIGKRPAYLAMYSRRDGRPIAWLSRRVYVVLLVECEALFPGLAVHAPSASEDVLRDLGYHQCEFEADEFNSLYTVSSKDVEFASWLINPRMMSWLVDDGAGFGYEVAREYAVISYEVTVRGADIPTLEEAAKGFIHAIPDEVWQRYSATRPKRTKAGAQ